MVFKRSWVFVEYVCNFSYRGGRGRGNFRLVEVIKKGFIYFIVKCGEDVWVGGLFSMCKVEFSGRYRSRGGDKRIMLVNVVCCYIGMMEFYVIIG